MIVFPALIGKIELEFLFLSSQRPLTVHQGLGLLGTVLSTMQFTKYQRVLLGTSITRVRTVFSSLHTIRGQPRPPVSHVTVATNRIHLGSVLLRRVRWHIFKGSRDRTSSRALELQRLRNRLATLYRQMFGRTTSDHALTLWRSSMMG